MDSYFFFFRRACLRSSLLYFGGGEGERKGEEGVFLFSLLFFLLNASNEVSISCYVVLFVYSFGFQYVS